MPTAYGDIAAPFVEKLKDDVRGARQKSPVRSTREDTLTRAISWVSPKQTSTSELDLALQTWVVDGSTVPAPAAAGPTVTRPLSGYPRNYMKHALPRPPSITHEELRGNWPHRNSGRWANGPLIRPIRQSIRQNVRIAIEHLLRDALADQFLGPDQKRLRLTTTSWRRSMKSLTSNDIKTALEIAMSQITARIPDELVSALDQAARGLNRSRADIIRQAIELYLDDFEDLTTAVERLRDPSDAVLDWDQVKRELLDQN